MTGHEERAEDGAGAGRRSRALKAAGLTLAAVLVLGTGTAGWAYWHLNDNIRSVDIDNALGDDRPARAVTTPAPSSSASAAALPTEAVNILVLGSDSRSGEENQELGGGDSSGARSERPVEVAEVSQRT